MNDQTPSKILARDFRDILFPFHRRPFPDLDDTYELELAFYESKLLTDEKLIGNGATKDRLPFWSFPPAQRCKSAAEFTRSAAFAMFGLPVRSTAEHRSGELTGWAILKSK